MHILSEESKIPENEKIAAERKKTGATVFLKEEPALKVGLDVGSTTIKCVVLDDAGNIVYSTYERHFSHILEKSGGRWSHNQYQQP